MNSKNAFVLCAVCFASGLLGMVIGASFALALKENTQPWAIPAIVIGALALLVGGVLLLPAAIRHTKNKKDTAAV